jgi:hypothetical protein
MPFPHLKTARRPLTVLDLMVLTGLCALPLAAVVAPEPSGPGGATPAVWPLVLFLLLIGAFLGSLAESAARLHSAWQVVPTLSAFVALAFLYILDAFFLLQGALYAGVLTLVAQWAAVLYLAYRP